MHPIDGFRVVNSQSAIFGRARLTDARNVDLPMLGSPSSPTSARDLSWSLRVFSSPFCPSFCSPDDMGWFLLPLPPFPPRATTKCYLLESMSATNCYFQSPYSLVLIQYTKVPMGTWTTFFPPAFPSRPLIPPETPLAPARFLVLKCLKSDRPVLDYKITSAPLPPHPPSGGPLILYLSLRKVRAPSPPLPPLTLRRTQSVQLLSYLLENQPNSTDFLVQKVRTTFPNLESIDYYFNPVVRQKKQALVTFNFLVLLYYVISCLKDVDNNPNTYLVIIKMFSAQLGRNSEPNPQVDMEVRRRQPTNELSLRNFSPLNDEYCFQCKESGVVICCPNCPKAYHNKCLTAQFKTDISSDNSWVCPCCVLRTSCAICDKKVEQESEDNVVCSICCRLIHRGCHPYSKEFGVVALGIQNSKEVMCVKCLDDSGICILMDKAKTSRGIFWKINPYYASIHHHSWFSEEWCYHTLKIQAQRSNHNIALSYNNSFYANSAIVDKVLRIKIPLAFTTMGMDEVGEMVKDPSRSVEYGELANFKFLVKWKTIDTRLSTWQDECLMRRVSFRAIEDIMSWSEYANGMISRANLHQAIQARYNRQRDVEEDYRVEKAFLSQTVYFLKSVNLRQSLDFSIPFLSNLHRLKPDLNPTLIITTSPQKWYTQLTQQARQLRVVCLKGQESHRKYQIANEMSLNGKWILDVLILNNEIFTREYIDLKAVGFQILVLDSEVDYESYELLTLSEFDRYKKIIIYDTSSRECMERIARKKLPEVATLPIQTGPKQQQAHVASLGVSKQMQIQPVGVKRQLKDSILLNLQVETQNALLVRQSMMVPADQSQPVSFDKAQRLRFLRFIIIFGMNFDSLEEMHEKLVAFQQGHKFFEGTPREFQQMRLYTMEFIKVLSSQASGEPYFWEFDKQTIVQRIGALAILKKASIFFENTPSRFPLPTKFHIANSKANNKVQQIFSSAWKIKDDLQLIKLILEFGYSKWNKIASNFYKDDPFIVIKGHHYLHAVLWPELVMTHEWMAQIERILHIRGSSILAHKAFEFLVPLDA